MKIEEDEVINLIIEETNIHKEYIKLNSDLLKDLNIDGNDGYEFIEKFNKKFNPKPLLNPEVYFNPEYFSWKAIFKINKPLKVSTLIKISKQ